LYKSSCDFMVKNAINAAGIFSTKKQGE
jgi:hypothetical protein